jgi:hypothetical protein
MANIWHRVLVAAAVAATLAGVGIVSAEATASSDVSVTCPYSLPSPPAGAHVVLWGCNGGVWTTP